MSPLPMEGRRIALTTVVHVEEVFAVEGAIGREVEVDPPSQVIVREMACTAVDQEKQGKAGGNETGTLNGQEHLVRMLNEARDSRDVNTKESMIEMCVSESMTSGNEIDLLVEVVLAGVYHQVQSRQLRNTDLLIDTSLISMQGENLWLRQDR